MVHPWSELRPMRPARCWLAWALATGVLAVRLAALEVRYEGTGSPLPTNIVLTVQRETARLVQSHQFLFQRQAPADFRITYHISQTRAEYERRAEASQGATRGVAGYTQTRQEWQLEPVRVLTSVRARVETWRKRPTNELLAVLLHESAHAVTAGFVGSTPLWFTEGSAELLGTPAAGAFKLHRQEEGARWRSLADLLARGRLPPLREFLEAGSYGDWDRLFAGDRGLAYTASYSLFYFFSAQPTVFPVLARWLDSKSVAAGEDLNRAFAEYLNAQWPGGLAAFEQTWHAWIRARARAQPPAKPAGGATPPPPAGRR
jgi:hypothetical protein